MATTPKTVRTYPLNSIARDFTIPFEYLARKFVVVTLIGATRRELVLNTDYRFSTATMITTNKAWGPSDNFTLIEIRRLTSASERLVDFADGSILRAYDLNISSVQSLHIAEEARDLTADTISVNNDGQLDARARRIVNLADAIDDGDAVNLRMQKVWAGSALNQAQAAANSAIASNVGAENSRNSAQASANSAASAAKSDAQATSQRYEAERQAGIAGGYANAASASQGAAQNWAAAPEDQVVSNGLYSSLHYSRKSANSAIASSNSANASNSSRIESTSQADRAKAEADRAKAEADKLGNFNGLAGTIEYTSGNNIGFKGDVSLRGNLLVKSDGDGNVIFQKNDGSQKCRITADLNGDLTVIDDGAGKVRFRIAKSGYVTSTYGQNFAGGTTFSDATQFNGTNVFSGAAQFKSGVVQVYANGQQTANAHVWFYGPDGSSRGIIYAGNDNAIRVQPGNQVAATFISDGSSSFNNVNVNYLTTQTGLNVVAGTAYTHGNLENTGRVASYRDGVGANSGMYSNCHFMAQTNDGSAPAYGFHRGGQYALALWLNGSDLHMQASDGSNRALVTNANFMSYVGGQMTSDIVGCVATMQNATGAQQGQNAQVSGGQLKYSTHNQVSGVTGSGNWRNLGVSNPGGVSNWIRYA
ncbi:tail fiber protein [Pseudomonas phage PPPL-1]|uniref:Tail fiber protein n=1 Tax=Pseudomonas phage PPPL-1 TaxID=1755692 RepID=A0A0S2MVP8_9CAUD|nr:tail fiber protein [Pseudomonas phage PPPL-1]ALO80003.1 tail fiber protein [Pseudomonas phage PPPL-1]